MQLLFALLACSSCCLVPAQEQDRAYRLQETVRGGLLHSDGSLWFATNHEGLYHFVDGSFVHYDAADGLVSNYVSAIVEDAQGRIWCGTDRGLCRFDGKFVHVPIPWDGDEDLWGPGLNANLVLCLHRDRQGHLWFGTWGNGVHRFDPSAELDPTEADGDEAGATARYAFSSFLQERGATYGDDEEHRNAIQSICEDAEGNLFFASMSHGGVSRFDGETWTHWAMDDGLSDDMVFSCCVDRSGDLWFGMLGNRDGGLDRFDGERFEHFTTADGLGSNNVVSILEDREGRLWLGSHRSAFRVFERGADGQAALSPFRHAGRTFEQIHFALEDGEGRIWFGGGYGQLFRYDGSGLTDFTQKR